MLHLLHLAAQHETYCTCCTCCLQDFLFVTPGSLQLLPARSPISNTSCIKQGCHPCQVLPASVKIWCTQAPDVCSENLAVTGSRRAHTVNIPPVKPLVCLQDADVRSEKLAVEDRIRLSCAASWVQHPATLFLPHNGRGFEVRVDPMQLPEGMSYTEVLGWDSTAAWRGPLFR